MISWIENVYHHYEIPDLQNMIKIIKELFLHFKGISKYFHKHSDKCNGVSGMFCSVELKIVATQHEWMMMNNNFMDYKKMKNFFLIQLRIISHCQKELLTQAVTHVITHVINCMSFFYNDHIVSSSLKCGAQIS